MKAAFLSGLLCCAMAMALSAEPPTDGAPSAPSDPRERAKREAWGHVAVVVAQLEQSDPAAFPGIHAWLRDFHQTADHLPALETGQHFPAIDSDALVTHSPRFWAAYYEIAPADPGLSVLHSALLLSGGEAQRASAFAVFGLQRAGVSGEFKSALESLIAGAQAAQARSFELVREGERRQDARDFGGALRCYDAALADWPGNAWAHYERGFALRAKAIADAGRTAPASEPVNDPLETVECFARARQHDPFHLMAYQGTEAGALTGMMALVRTGLPIWEAMRKHPETAVSRQALRDLSDACHDAGIDDFALAVRQLLIARNKRYQPEDQAFITASVERLARGASVAATLARIGGDPQRLALQIIPPTPPTNLAKATTEIPPGTEPAVGDDPTAKAKEAEVKAKTPAPKKSDPDKPKSKKRKRS